MYCAKNPPIYDNRLDLTTEQSMMMYVAEIGQVERGRQCHLMLDHQNKRKKSFALLYYILHARDQYNPSSAMMENAKNHGRTKIQTKLYFHSVWDYLQVDVQVDSKTVFSPGQKDL